MRSRSRDTPKRECLYSDCLRPPVAHVSGGVKPGERGPGWSGDYCTTHAVGCVDTQLWQVQRGMPITIRPLS